MIFRSFLVAVATFCATVAAGFFILLQRPLDRLDGLSARVDKVRSEYAFKKRLALNLEFYRRERHALEGHQAAVARAVPDHRDAGFSAVRSAAEARRLRIGFLEADQEERKLAFFAQLGGRVQVTGRFHDVATFITDLTQLPASVQLDEFVMERSAVQGHVRMTGSLRTFRYLGEEEVAAQRRQAAARMKGT